MKRSNMAEIWHSGFGAGQPEAREKTNEEMIERIRKLIEEEVNKCY